MKFKAQAAQSLKIFNRPSYKNSNRLHIASGNKSGLDSPYTRTNRTQNWTPLTQSDQKSFNKTFVFFKSILQYTLFTTFTVVLILIFPKALLLVSTSFNMVLDLNVASYEVYQYESIVTYSVSLRVFLVLLTHDIKYYSSRLFSWVVLQDTTKQPVPRSEDVKLRNLPTVNVVDELTSNLYRSTFKTMHGLTSLNDCKVISDVKAITRYPNQPRRLTHGDLSPRLKSLELATQVQYEWGVIKDSLEGVLSNQPRGPLSRVNSYQFNQFTPSRALEGVSYGIDFETHPLVRRTVSAREFSKFTVGNFDTITSSFNKLSNSQDVASYDRILYKYSLSAPSTYKTSNFLTNLKRALSKSYFATDVTNRNIWASNLLNSDVIQPHEYSSLVDSLKTLTRNKTLAGLPSTNLYQKLENQEASWNWYLSRNLFLNNYTSYNHSLVYTLGKSNRDCFTFTKPEIRILLNYKDLISRNKVKTPLNEVKTLKTQYLTRGLPQDTNQELLDDHFMSLLRDDKTTPQHHHSLRR